MQISGASGRMSQQTAFLLQRQVQSGQLGLSLHVRIGIQLCPFCRAQTGSQIKSIWSRGRNRNRLALLLPDLVDFGHWIGIDMCGLEKSAGSLHQTWRALGVRRRFAHFTSITSVLFLFPGCSSSGAATHVAVGTVPSAVLAKWGRRQRWICRRRGRSGQALLLRHGLQLLLIILKKVESVRTELGRIRKRH